MDPQLRKRLTAAGAGAVALAVATVGYFEGTKPTPYLDPIGIPTVCTGHTGNVEMGRTYSKAECDALLAGDLGKAFADVARCTRVRLGEPTRAALASFAFNVGGGAYCRSTLARRINAGEGAPACDELLRFVYAGGKKLPGLVKRRAAERELCIEGFRS
ncbi:lysozyme [Parvibaculum sp.]|uniref:lysozyme n=1 Tax=Parvibaculum sp. TaxID=2024848 RepID=UPI002BA9C8F8|nr:lysozyme [Parvibaculum sp.]HUD52794.1 lysozyme [Parvibaculum sp.]